MTPVAAEMLTLQSWHGGRVIMRQIQEDEYVFNQNKVTSQGMLYDSRALIGVKVN